MSEKKTLTEGHIRGQIKGDVKPPKCIQNGYQKPPTSEAKPSGAPPAPTKSGK